MPTLLSLKLFNFWKESDNCRARRKLDVLKIIHIFRHDYEWIHRSTLCVQVFCIKHAAVQFPQLSPFKVFCSWGQWLVTVMGYHLSIMLVSVIPVYIGWGFRRLQADTPGCSNNCRHMVRHIIHGNKILAGYRRSLDKLPLRTTKTWAKNWKKKVSTPELTN